MEDHSPPPLPSHGASSAVSTIVELKDAERSDVGEGGNTQSHTHLATKESFSGPSVGSLPLATFEDSDWLTYEPTCGSPLPTVTDSVVLQPAANSVVRVTTLLNTPLEAQGSEYPDPVEGKPPKRVCCFSPPERKYFGAPLPTAIAVHLETSEHASRRMWN